MSHTFTEEGRGRSEKSLTAAIANAFGNALKNHDFGGDHLCTTSIVIDGYDYDGKTYFVRVRVIIFDHELAKEDVYKEIKKLQEEQDIKQHLIDDYHAAMLYAHRLGEQHHYMRDVINQLMEQHGGVEHIDSMSVIAPHNVFQTMAHENGVDFDLQPIYRQAHVDMPTPTLGPGSASESGKTDKAALPIFSIACFSMSISGGREREGSPSSMRVISMAWSKHRAMESGMCQSTELSFLP